MTMQNIKQKVIIIYGATASGKSDLALKIAEKMQGTIINADSMQVYNDLQILTARPDLSKTDVPHKLYGFLNGSQECSAGIYAKQASDIIKKVSNPIVVGGTGLYIESLTKGLSPIPEVSPTIKNKYRSLEITSPELHNILAAKDNLMAKKLMPNDRQRIIRALEVLETTGKSLLFWQQEPLQKMLEADFFNIFVSPSRSELYNKCNLRFDEMIKLGAIDEVKQLLAKNYNTAAPIMKALGVKEISLYLKGDLTLENAAELAKTATRQYAKRQITWFKNRFKADLIVNPLDNLEKKQLFASLNLS